MSDLANMKRLPMIAMQGMVVLPGMVGHIDLKKGESVTLWQGDENQTVAPVTMSDDQKPNPWGEKLPERICAYRQPDGGHGYRCVH